MKFLFAAPFLDLKKHIFTGYFFRYAKFKNQNIHTGWIYSMEFQNRQKFSVISLIFGPIHVYKPIRIPRDFPSWCQIFHISKNEAKFVLGFGPMPFLKFSR